MANEWDQEAYNKIKSQLAIAATGVDKVFTLLALKKQHPHEFAVALTDRFMERGNY